MPNVIYLTEGIHALEPPVVACFKHTPMLERPGPCIEVNTSKLGSRCRDSFRGTAFLPAR